MKKGAILGKKQMVLAMLVLALGVAVYLNFVLIPPNTAVTGDTGDKKLGDTAYVNNNLSSPAGKPASSGPSGEANSAGKASAVSAVSGADDNYFATARKDRQKAHDEALDALKEIINNVKAEKAAKEQVSATAALLSKNIEKENAIETLLKGKGYADAVAVIAEDNVTVVVKAANLLDSQTLQIQDIVVSQTKMPLEHINIIPKK